MKKIHIVLFLLLLIISIFANTSRYSLPPNPVEVNLTIDPDKPCYLIGEKVNLIYSIFLNKRKSPEDEALEYLIETSYSKDCLEIIDDNQFKEIIHINDNNIKLYGSIGFKTTKQTDEIKFKMRTYRSFGPDGKDKIIETQNRFTEENPPNQIAGSYYDSIFNSEIINNSIGKLAIVVYDLQKKPIEDVQVKILGLNLEQISNEKGHAIFIIPAGYHNIQFRKKGYVNYSYLNVAIENNATSILNSYLPEYHSSIDSIEFFEYCNFSFFPSKSAINESSRGLDNTGDLLIQVDELHSHDPFYFIIDQLNIGQVSLKHSFRRILNIPVGSYTLKVLDKNLKESAIEKIEIENNLTTEVRLDSLLYKYKNGNKESEIIDNQ